MAGLAVSEWQVPKKSTYKGSWKKKTPERFVRNKLPFCDCFECYTSLAPQSQKHAWESLRVCSVRLLVTLCLDVVQEL